MNKKLLFLYGAVFAAAFLSALPFVGVFGDANPSVGYLLSRPLSPWSIMALVSAGENPPLDSLKTVGGEKAIDLEAPMLALASAGKDPRTFGSEDLTARLKSFYDGVQLGDANIVNDDIFGLLALRASGERSDDAVLVGIKNFILSEQNSDGGFSFAVGGASDTNTTAAAIMALRAAGVSASEGVMANAAAYLKGVQNVDGGFPYDPKSSWGTASDASSDAWVIMAVTALGEDGARWEKDGHTPASHLGTLKQEGGFYLYQTGGEEDSFTPVTTSYALLALSGKTLPVRIIEPEGGGGSAAGVSFGFRIEGKSATLCSGEARGVFALDAVRRANEQCGTPYHITSSALGEYVDEIGGEKASGASGWMYAVNNAVPSVGAGGFKLSEGDAVLWYFGDMGTPLHTDVSLEATIPAPAAGGSPSPNNPETPPALSIVVGGAGETLSFGALSRGAAVEKEVTIRNGGANSVTLSANVSGDAVFRRYLSLSGRSWRAYRAALSAGSATSTLFSLSLPADYGDSGRKTGMLTFWATPAAQ